MDSLIRFIDAQLIYYPIALKEIEDGEKRGHWMWFIFPQIKGLGISEKSTYYSIKDKKEAKEYLLHPVLGKRLYEICNVLLTLESDSAEEIFGYPDNLKLKSSMTLFDEVSHEPVFSMVLDKFFSGSRDIRTLKILEELEALQET